MRGRFAILLAVAAICATTAWAGWTSESLVTGSKGVVRTFSGQSHAHKVVYATDGVGHLVWQGGPSSDPYPGIWYNRYNPGSGSRPGSWTADFAIAPLNKKEKAARCFPCIALDGDGRTIHVVWSRSQATVREPDSVCYRMCTQDKNGNDKWGAVVHLCAALYLGRPVVACAPNEPNHVFVCWRYLVPEAVGWSMVTRFREYVNGAWKAVVRLDSTYMSAQDAPSIAVAPNGDVFVAYDGYDDNLPHGKLIFVKTRTNGVWGEPVNVTKNFSSFRDAPYTIEVNPVTLNPHIVFGRLTLESNGAGQDTVSAVYHTYRNASGDWLTTPELISEPRRRPCSGAPTMAFVSSGVAHVVWHDTVPPTGHGVMYSYCLSEGGTWSTPEWLVSGYSSGQFIAVEEPAHAIHVVWGRDYNSNCDEIWWKSKYLGGGGSQAEPMAMSQSRIELFPNPAKAGRVTLQYSLPRAGQMAVTLLDVSGRAVRRSEFGVRSSGEGSFSIDMKDLNAGVYVIKLESGSSSLTRKLVMR